MSRKLRRKAAAAARQMNSVSQTTEMPETQPSPAPQAPSTPAAESTDLRHTYYAKFEPADAVERGLVDEMINAKSRQQFLATIENNAFAQMMSAPPSELAAAFEAHAKLLTSLDRVRKCYDSQFSRALATLTKLRAATKSAKPAPQPQPLKPESSPATHLAEFRPSASPLVSHTEPDPVSMEPPEIALPADESLNGSPQPPQPDRLTVDLRGNTGGKSCVPNG